MLPLLYLDTKGCKQCDKALEELEKIDDASDQFGVDFVKINDKRVAKTHGVEEFPALIYFRNKEPVRFTGDLENEESVLDFLTSLESMDNPDRIEEVNSKILDKIIHETNYVAVLFCEYLFHYFKRNCKLLPSNHNCNMCQ